MNPLLNEFASTETFLNVPEFRAEATFCRDHNEKNLKIEIKKWYSKFILENVSDSMANEGIKNKAKYFAKIIYV